MNLGQNHGPLVHISLSIYIYIYLYIYIYIDIDIDIYIYIHIHIYIYICIRYICISQHVAMVIPPYGKIMCFDPHLTVGTWSGARRWQEHGLDLPLQMRGTSFNAWDELYHWNCHEMSWMITVPIDVPSGTHTKNYGQSPYLMRKLTISIAMFNGEL